MRPDRGLKPRCRSQYPPYGGSNGQEPIHRYPDVPYQPPVFPYPPQNAAHLPFPGLPPRPIPYQAGLPAFPPFPPRPFNSNTVTAHQRPNSQQDSYDPHQPATAYPQPGPPPFANGPPPFSEVTRRPRPRSPPRRHFSSASLDVEPEVTLLTPPKTVDRPEGVFAVHSLAPSHLPLEKLVATNRQDAIEMHRAVAHNHLSSWYACGSCRAAEGWSAAVEWRTDANRSGKIMRGSLGEADSLNAELLAICKAAEGFQDLLRQSLKDGTVVSRQLIVFSDSQAAIVSIDTSSRPLSIRFDELWSTILSEFPDAQMTLLWLPRDADDEPYVLSKKIATVASANSYARRRKEGTLPDLYRRAGGDDQASPGSCQPGSWQRGDADPSRHKSPLQRPQPSLPTPVPVSAAAATTQRAKSRDLPGDAMIELGVTVFVTDFPDAASAKDIGILFAQFGEIIAVDIYHVDTAHPRFAHVKFGTHDAGLAAVNALHRKPVELNNAFANEHASDLEVWRQWNGVLTVMPTPAGRLVPSDMLHLFPGLPAHLSDEPEKGAAGPATDTDTMSTMLSRLSPHLGDKRPPPESTDVNNGVQDFSSPSKRARVSFPSTNHGAKLPEAVTDKHEVPNAGEASQSIAPQREADDHALTPLAAPSTPTVKTEPVIPHVEVSGPPTPLTALGLDHIAAGAAGTQAGEVERSHTCPSAATSQVTPIVPGAKTRATQLRLIKVAFSSASPTDWIAHSCLLAEEIDITRRALVEDLTTTNDAFTNSRSLEGVLTARFSSARVDAFVVKVLGVLDGIAKAEAAEADESIQTGEGVGEDLDDQLKLALDSFCAETREAVESFGVLYEYLVRGLEAQERKKFEVLRRLKVLEGMEILGDAVSAVVRYLLTESG